MPHHTDLASFLDGPEVRYQLLRPAEVVARREEWPIAYVPIGTLEWHGPQNPLGADTLQAETLSILCAQKGGGLAFPPLYYGENRSQALMESTSAPETRKGIAAGMHLPPENFEPGNFPFTETQQSLAYHALLVHILAEINTLGFKVGVIVAGHYPLIDHARAAALQFNKSMLARGSGMLAWAFCDYLLVDDQYECAGDHAGGWETSHCMASHPGRVDLDTLPPRGETVVGAGGRMPPHDANAEFGREIYEAAAEVAVREARDRLENPSRYARHGRSQCEGLWKDDA